MSNVCQVYEHNSRDAIIAAGVRAFPTFHFYVGGGKVDEYRGANIQAVEQKVLQHKASARCGGGQTHRRGNLPYTPTAMFMPCIAAFIEERDNVLLSDGTIGCRRQPKHVPRRRWTLAWLLVLSTPSGSIP